MIEQLLQQLHADLPREELERKLAKLKKINLALMQRVEKSMDQQGNAYSLFQTAITLEGQVRVRTEELKNALSRLERTNDELMTARDTSERANRFKTRFFTAVGHDLLQPLHAARLSAGALADRNPSEHHQRLANRIEHALTTIEELLRSILDISKLEAGVITPSVRIVPLRELFASLVVDLEPLAREKGLVLKWRRSDLAVMSDPLMLRRILQNLMANAVQYTQRGGIMVAARRRGADVNLEVWDTGPGIPPEERKSIFEEFQRGPAGDQPAVGGFGLGLSIVQRMSEALGHSVGLCSRVGRGTRFTITAPFAGKVHYSVVQPATPSFGRPYGLAGAKIAVIDNDGSVLDAMQSLLEHWGCEVSLLRSLDDADRLIASGAQPELLLVDYHLDRGACGLTAVERFRAATDHPLPAIVLTADHSAATADHARSDDCEILIKPVKPAELRALMAHLVARTAR
jgi:signal transduction histidine kinase/CheY-like chemotaxis protein